MRRSHSSLTLALLGLGMTAAQAADDSLEEVTVFGQLENTLPQELARVGNDVSTITQATLRNGGYVDAAQALERQTPGLYLSPAHGPFSYTDVSLQGSRRNDVLWVVDGVRINNRLYNTNAPNDSLPAAMIERIEVLKDGQGLFYGTQAVAGAINIVTRGLSETPGGGITVGGGTNDNVNASGYFRGAVGGNKLLGYVSYDQAGGYRPYDVTQPSAIDRKRSYEMLTFGGKYGRELTEDLAFSASWQHADGKVDDLAIPFQWNAGVNFRNEEIVTARLDYSPAGRTQFALKAYLHDWDSHYTQSSNDGTPPYAPVVEYDNAYWGFKDFGISALAKVPTGSELETWLGYDYQNYKGRDAVLLIEGITEHVHALFAQLRTTAGFSEKAHLAIGARYNHAGEDQSAMVWNASGRFDFSDALFVEGVVGTSFRLPDAYELYAIDPFDTLGNPDLKGEKSRNLNLSIGGQAEDVYGIQWRVTGFLRKVKDLIQDVDGVFANTENAVKTRGYEAQLGGRIGAGFTGSVGYTWADVHVAGSNLQLARAPRSYVKAALDYASPDERFGTGATFYYLGDRFQDLSTFGRRNSGNYGVLDLNAHYAFGSAMQHRVNLRLENALDRDYATGVGRGFVDVSEDPYLYRRRGVPRTLFASYSIGF